MSETRIEDRRTIVHDVWEDGRHTRTATTPIDAPGEIHHCDPPAEAARAAQEEQATVDALIATLEPSIGRARYLDLEAAINAYAGAIRSEAVARMVAAAQDMIDYPIAAFLMPSDGEQKEAGAADEP